MEIYGLMGAELQFYQMKKVLEMDGADDCLTISRYFMPQNYTLKNG